MIIHTQESRSRSISVDITDSISEFEDYEKLFKLLPTLTQDDYLEVHLNTPGGRCDIGFMIADRLLQCRCPIKMIVEYPTSSMGAIIAMCGDELEMWEDSYLMFHDYSGGSSGKGEETLQHSTNYRKVFRKRFERLCKPFLTQKECDSMFKGEDIYIHDDDADLQKRVSRHYR